LLKTGDKALENCFPQPGKGFAVAVLTSKGNIYSGSSYGSDTYTLTMHSESVALAHAAQHGETEIIAITGPNCHICKQIIWESSLHSGIEVLIILRENGKIKQIPISELMPYPWPDLQGNT
jgi:cytidine deaminase